MSLIETIAKTIRNPVRLLVGDPIPQDVLDVEDQIRAGEIPEIPIPQWAKAPNAVSIQRYAGANPSLRVLVPTADRKNVKSYLVTFDASDLSKYRVKPEGIHDRGRD